MRCLRLDVAGQLTGVRRTPQGGLIAPANLTRVGVFTYEKPGGGVTRELRLPEEVFNADSLATLASAPVTIGHRGQVTPETWRNVSVGHVDGTPTHDDRYVKADVRIMDENAISLIERKDLVELSCGYTSDIEQTSGTHEGEKYDAIQRNIQYNHVALGPKDWGRAGNEVRLRMDSGYAVQRLDVREPDIFRDPFGYLRGENMYPFDQLRGDAPRHDESEAAVQAAAEHNAWCQANLWRPDFRERHDSLWEIKFVNGREQWRKR